MFGGGLTRSYGPQAVDVSRSLELTKPTLLDLDYFLDNRGGITPGASVELSINEIGQD